MDSDRAVQHLSAAIFPEFDMLFNGLEATIRLIPDEEWASGRTLGDMPV